MTAPLLILVAFGVIAGAATILLRPASAFVLILIMFAVEQLLQSYFDILQTHQSLFNYMVGGAALLAVFLRMTRRDPITSGLNNPVTYLIIAQFGLWLAAMLYSPLPDVAIENLKTSYAFLVLLLLVLPLLVVDLPEFRRLMVGTMIVGSIMAVLIVLNPRSSYYGGRLMLDVGMTGLRRDSFGNPLAVAELGGMVALIAALIAPVEKRGLFTFLRLAAFIMGLGLAIGSGSRGQVLATVVAGILFYPAARRVNSVRNFFLTAFGLLVLMAGLYVTFKLFIGEQNQRRWDIALMVQDITLRFEMCWRFLEAYLASPSHWLFGLGTNSWAEISGESEMRGNYVHNIAVEVLCEHGLVGATIFAATVILSTRAGVRMWLLHRDDPALRSAVAIILALGAFMLFNALKQGSITSAAPFYIWLVMAKIARREQTVMAEAAAHEPLEPALEHGGDDYEYEPAPGYALAR